MMNQNLFIWLSLGLLVLNGLMVLMLLSRTLKGVNPGQQQALKALEELNQRSIEGLSQLKFQQDELQKQLRNLSQEMEVRQGAQTQALQQAMSQSRTESQQAQSGLQQLIIGQFGQGNQVQSERLSQFSDTLHKTTGVLRDQLSEMRQSVDKKLKELQEGNAIKLEEMRRTVDEKLHATLEQRLGESFKQVSDRLEQVYKGLGEMQSLAAGVGDLKRVLTNVKTRGTWGEIQLQALLEQILIPGQYEKNVKTVPGSDKLVEFAIKLPGKGDDDAPCWLPIDSKFPKEQYERLLDAFDRADAEAVAIEGKALETAVRAEAKNIAERYLAPPHTTDFGILFLPTEGLYAEIVKRPGLVDDLQRLHRVTVAGPVTLATLLNALQLGFKTLALEKRSSEVWQVLSAVKTEFGKFGEVLAKTKKNLEMAARSIESAETRTRQMQRKLKSVDELPAEQSKELLGLGLDDFGLEVDEPNQA